MTSAACPRCNAAHDGQVDKLGWATCRQCAYCWQMNPQPKAVRGQTLSGSRPPAAIPPAAPPAAAPVAQPPKPPMPKRPMGSGEYAPDDGFGEQPHTAPLAARDNASGPSRAVPVIK